MNSTQPPDLKMGLHDDLLILREYFHMFENGKKERIEPLSCLYSKYEFNMTKTLKAMGNN